jgi:hypothetical protein
MIKLRKLLLETYAYSPYDVIVGSADINGKVIGSENWKTHGYMIRDHPEWRDKSNGSERFDWRFNKPKKTLFWWAQLGGNRSNSKGGS